MSAWMVDKVHIDLLVAVALHGPRDGERGQWYPPMWEGERLSLERADALGDALVRENLSSIHHRYPDTITKPDDTPGDGDQYWLKPYTFPYWFPCDGYRMTALEALKSVSCYEYQSCEHPEWEESAAAKFCDALRRALISALPGWEDAPWGWDADAMHKAKLNATTRRGGGGSGVGRVIAEALPIIEDAARFFHADWQKHIQDHVGDHGESSREKWVRLHGIANKLDDVKKTTAA